MRRAAFEGYLTGVLRRAARPAPRLAAAMRYAALSPGKRLRPLLALAACEAVGGPWRDALPAAAAIECVHAFSLVHDDLPAMDDDDFRRGRPTTHRRFGEALGILAGDGLLALAFEELVRLTRRGVPARRVLAAVELLARASGARHLVGGQALDITAEGRRVSRPAVIAIHRNKTGALMGAALALGALAGGASGTTVARLDRLGRRLGLAFQIQDDLLNSRSTLGRLGKRSGTDRARGKATFPAVAGPEASQRTVARLLSGVQSGVRATCRSPRPVLTLIEAVAMRER
jgi:geranylgeranyl diphosphate synthase type II